LRKDDPPKLGKTDSRKSNRFKLDDLKDKTSNIKDKSDQILKKDSRPKLGKSGHGKSISSNQGKSLSFNFDDLKEKIPWIKDRRIIMFLALAVIIVAAGVIAGGNNHQTTLNQTNNTTIPTITAQNHFDNGIISFDYPNGWNVTNGTKAPLLVTVSKDENNSFSVLSEKLGNTTFAERIVQWRQTILQSGAITYEGNVTVDNSSGYNIEATYKVNSTIYNTRGVAISKNNNVYFIIFIFNKSLLDYKGEMDQVINSFHVK